MVSRTLAFLGSSGNSTTPPENGGQRVGEIVVAVNARQLFQQIDLALDIETPGGNLHAE